MYNKWNDHHELEGKHAFLGASQYHWLNWTPDTLRQRFVSRYAQELGTALHEICSSCIKNRITLNENCGPLIQLELSKMGIPSMAYNPEEILKTLMPFVNDAVYYRMDSEVILYYSPYCFGTADAIKYDEKKHILKIHDYKSGNVTAKFEQLMVYAALFYLEYKKDPKENQTILSIYQHGSAHTCIVEAEEIEKIMDAIRFNNDYIYDTIIGRKL